MASSIYFRRDYEFEPRVPEVKNLRPGERDAPDWHRESSLWAIEAARKAQLRSPAWYTERNLWTPAGIASPRVYPKFTLPEGYVGEDLTEGQYLDQRSYDEERIMWAKREMPELRGLWVEWDYGRRHTRVRAATLQRWDYLSYPDRTTVYETDKHMHALEHASRFLGGDHANERFVLYARARTRITLPGR